MTVSQKPQKEITGRHVLIAVILFFGLIISVNAYFITAAVKSFRGEDVKGSYRQGLDYDQRISERAQERALGWVVRGNVINGDVSNLLFSLSDETGTPVRNLFVKGRLRHPTDRALDLPLTFEESSAGIYQADFTVKNGQWRFVGEAQKGDQKLSFEYDVIVQ